MLILSRGVGETIVIGEAIYCTVIGFDRGEARLAFEAPPSISLFRDEIQQMIWQKKQDFKKEAEWLAHKTVMDTLISQLKAERLTHRGSSC